MDRYNVPGPRLMTARQPFHLLHDPVAVAFVTGQGQHDVEDRRRERQQASGVG